MKKCQFHQIEKPAEILHDFVVFICHSLGLIVRVASLLDVKQLGSLTGLDKARGYLETIHKNHPSVSWADLIQLASATAIEMAGASVCWKLDVDVVVIGWGWGLRNGVEQTQCTPRINPLTCVLVLCGGRWPSDSHEVWPCLRHWP